MSYETVRTHLVRCRRHAQESGEEITSLLEALEQLTNAVEADLTQIKVALGHVARLVEKPDPD